MKKVLRKILSIALATSVVMACFVTTAFAATTPVGVSYSAHVQNIGWMAAVTDGATAGTSGQSLRVEAFKISLTNAPAGAHINYQTHVQDKGWVAVASDGAIGGSTGESKRVEAIAMTISGMPGYSVEYRVHVQDIGWMSWVKNGAITGTVGQSKRIEAVQIRIVAPTTLAVAAVTPVDAATVKVSFTAPVNSTDAADLSNYSKNSVAPTAATVAADKLSVTLSFADAEALTAQIFTVQPIMSNTDAAVYSALYSQAYVYTDTTKPVISSVTCATSGSTASTVVVKASEPIAAGTTTIKIDGISQGTIADFAGTNTSTITGLALSTTATHTIEILNLTDLATTANVTAYTSQSFTVVTDTVKPTVTLSANSDKTILATFSKSMDAATVTAALVNGTVKDEALAAVVTTTAVVVADTDNKQFTIAITPALYTNTTTRTLYVVFASTIKDSLGNAMTATTQSVALVKDATKPAANAFSVTKDGSGNVTSIKVNFSEGLLAAAAGTVAVPTIVNSNGVLVTLTGLTSAAVAAGDKSVTWNCTATAVSGVYSFSFGSAIVSDQAETANTNAAFSYSYNMGTTTTTGFDLTSVANTGTNVIAVNYGTAVKGGTVVGSATLLTSYIMNGKALPDGTTIFLNGAQTIATITFPSQGIAATDAAAVFTVVGVQSLTNVTVNTHISTVAIVDNKAPVLLSAVLVGNTITLTFDEALNAGSATKANIAAVLAAFDIKCGGTSIVAGTTGAATAAPVAGDATKIQISITNVGDSTYSAASVVTVKTIGSVTDTSILANVIKADITVTATK